MAKKIPKYPLSQHYPALTSIALTVMLGIVSYFGLFYQQKAVAQDYSIRGFDVSHHQGEINWKKISPMQYQFVYLKATEGGDFKDQNFQQNWLKARERGLQYDSNCINTYTKEQLLKEIQIMNDQLHKHYGKQPIFYISKTFYHIVLMGNFSNTPLWVRDYEDKPELKDGRQWLFWQHSQSGKIDGIPKPVDLNVYAESPKQWRIFLKQQGIVDAK